MCLERKREAKNAIDTPIEQGQTVADTQMAGEEEALSALQPGHM